MKGEGIYQTHWDLNAEQQGVTDVWTNSQAYPSVYPQLMFPSCSGRVGDIARLSLTRVLCVVSCRY